MSNAILQRWVLSLRLKVSHVLESRMLSGKLFQTEAAECLKPRDANTVEVELLQIKFFDDDLSVRTGS